MLFGAQVDLSRLSDAYKRQYTRPSLDQNMAGRLFLNQAILTNPGLL